MSSSLLRYSGWGFKGLDANRRLFVQSILLPRYFSVAVAALLEIVHPAGQIRTSLFRGNPLRFNLGRRGRVTANRPPVERLADLAFEFVVAAAGDHHRGDKAENKDGAQNRRPLLLRFTRSGSTRLPGLACIFRQRNSPSSETSHTGS